MKDEARNPNRITRSANPDAGWWDDLLAAETAAKIAATWRESAEAKAWAKEMFALQAVRNGYLTGEPVWYVREDIHAREIGRAWQKGKEWEQCWMRRRLALAFVAGLAAAAIAFLAVWELVMRQIG